MANPITVYATKVLALVSDSYSVQINADHSDQEYPVEVAIGIDEPGVGFSTLRGRGSTVYEATADALDGTCDASSLRVDADVADSKVTALWVSMTDHGYSAEVGLRFAKTW